MEEGGMSYCIAILTDQEQEGQNCAEYIRITVQKRKFFH